MTAIKVELELVDGTFTTRMLHAGETMEQFNRNVSRTSPALRRMAADGNLVIRSMDKASEAGQGFLSTLRDVSIVTTALSVGFNKIINIQDTWVGAVVRTNAEFERLNHMLRSMSNAADPVADAADQVKHLVDMAKEAPFQLDNLTASFTKLKATGTDPMKGSMQALVDGIAAFGGNGESLERTVLGISQASGKGVIQMEELRQQIGESMPQAMGLMAAAMGVSIADLVQHISTGRMAAGPALESFYGELDRAFGGSARRMMQTFSGQLARTKTELQEFAQTIGGINADTGNANEGGFFDVVTKQLREFNNLLSSSGGQAFAKQVGSMLADVAQGIQWAIEKAIEFRHAIGNMAELAAWVVGLKVAAAALGALRNGYTSVVQGLQILSTHFAQANSAAALHQRAMLNTAASVASVDRAARLQAALGLRAMAGAAMSVVPIAGVLGLAIYEIADAFDVFGNRGRDAVATLREFGDLARDQIGNARKAVGSDQKDLIRDLQTINGEVKNTIFFGSPEEKRAQRDALRERLEGEYKIAERRKQIETDLGLIREAQTKAAEEDARKESEHALRELDRQQAARQRTYAVTREQIQKEADDRIKAGEKIDTVNADRAKKLYENSKELYQDLGNDLQTALTEAQRKAMEASVGPTGPQLAPLAMRLGVDALLERIDDLRKRSEALSLGGVATLPTIGESSNTEKDIEKLQKLLGKTSDTVESMTDEFNGANTELQKFQAAYARGAYGDKSNKQIQNLASSIELLLKKKAALDEFNSGAEDLQSDLESARLKIVEERLELEAKARGEELTEGEKIRARYENGGYKGLGPNSPAQAALQQAIQGLTMQGKVTDAVAVSVDKAFGQTTSAKITTMNDVLRETLNIVTGIGGGIDGIDLSQIGLGVTALANGGLNGPLRGMMGFTGMPTSGANLMSKNMGIFGDPRSAGWKENNITSIQASNGMTVQVHKAAASAFQGFLNDLLATGYKIDSLGGHNVRNKVNGKGLSEHAFGNAIDINPSKNPYGKDLITDMPANVRELAAKWGLSWGGDWKSVKDAMHFEWKGGQQAAAGQSRKVDLNKPVNLMNPFGENQGLDTSGVYADATGFLEKQVAVKREMLATTEALDAAEKENVQTKKELAGTKAEEEMIRKTKEANDAVFDLGENYARVKKAIAANTYGDTNEESENNKRRLKAAQELDAAEERLQKRKEAYNSTQLADLKFKEQELQINRQIEQLQAKIKNPNVKLDSSGLVQLQEQLDRYVSDIQTVYGKDSAEYAAALERKKQSLALFGQQEGLQAAASSAERTRTINQSLMSETQARQAALKQRLDEIDQEMEYQRSRGTLTVEMTRQFEAEKAAIRRQFAQQDPMTKQMTEWGNLQDNLAKTSTQWTDSIADGLTGLISGTGDLKSALQSLQNVANQVINMFVKKLMSSMIGPKTGASAGSKGGKGSKGMKGGGFFPAAPGAAVGLFHSGGIPGSGARQHAVVNPDIFKNARKFHSGANQFGGRRLLPGEMPAIVKKKEGIFTPEQMAALGPAGGSSNVQNVTVSAPVTVNASGGTPEQNADLASQISTQIEDTMRGVVVDEISRQMRPGNMLSAGKGR